MLDLREGEGLGAGLLSGAGPDSLHARKKIP